MPCGARLRRACCIGNPSAHRVVISQGDTARMKARVLNLALQGGGSYGAFTWGVLDRLLEDERIELDGLSGASAGAMNAAVLAYGFTTGGRLGARQALRRFWESVAASAPVASFAFL